MPCGRTTTKKTQNDMQGSFQAEYGEAMQASICTQVRALLQT